MSILLLNLLNNFLNFVFLSPKIRNFQKKRQWNIRSCQIFQRWGRLQVMLMNITQKQAKNDNQIRLKALVERENEELMGKWDGSEYMNEVNWP